MELGTLAGKLTFVGVLVLFILFEAAWLIWARHRNYDWKEASASIAVALIKRVVDVGTAGVAAAALFWVYEHRLWTIRLDDAATWIVFFLLFELVYYWHHRLAHEIRWLWATHSVHHSPESMNLSVAARLGWTGLLSGSFLFFAPLCLIGFHPIAVFLMLAASLFYQIWIHTEVIPKLGPLEWVLNTPSHHRVHHARNPRYLNRNFGGVLIVYDRLFGTLAKERADDPPDYGLLPPMRSLNPFVIALREWGWMARDVTRARSAREAMGYLFGPPGWAPGGAGEDKPAAVPVRLPE